MGALSFVGASFLLGEMQKVNAPFGSPGAQKTAQTACFGRAVGRIKLTAATAPKFWSFYPLESSRLMKKRSCYDPFFAENQFSPGDEAVLMGLVVRKCHFHVTACAEAHRLEPKGTKGPFGTFKPFGPAGVLRAPAGQYP